MGIEATIKTTREVLRQNLRIPPYQRPYRWTTKNVLQLLTDISTSMASGKREYRIGTVICHSHPAENGAEREYDIVDGQQRLTTIFLVLKESRICKEEFLDQLCGYLSFSDDSVGAIRQNRDFIKEWLSSNIPDSVRDFAEYILDKCKFVQIVVDDLGEAFQMFDTQNGRGKNLHPYNLLKAYHIRAMEQNTQDEKIQCDRNWESATQYDATPEIENDPNVDILAQLFGEQLFKSRLWCRNEAARDFGKSDIEEFKGFTIDKNHPINYPFQNPFLLQYLTEKFYRNVLAGTIGTKPRLATGDTGKSNPFVNVNQTIINGKAFFEYVETYVELYKKMFIELGSYQLAGFKRFFYLYCLTYKAEDQNMWEKARANPNAFRHAFNGAERTGDTSLRESYKSLCLVLFDKFGEKVFLKYYMPLYRLIYKIRMQNYAVKHSTALSAPASLFVLVSRAKNEAELLAINSRLASLQKEDFEHSDKLPESVKHFVLTGELQHD